MDGKLEDAGWDALPVYGAWWGPICELGGDRGGRDGEAAGFGDARNVDVEPLSWKELCRC